MTTAEKKTSSSGRSLAGSAKHLTETSPATRRAIALYYKREDELGRKVPRPATASTPR